MFISIDILIHFNSDWNIMMKTDASNYALTECLFQRDSDSELIKLVIFYFWKLIKSEQNWKIYVKEIIVIIVSLKK